MKVEKKIIYSLDELEEVAQELAQLLKAFTVVTFTGSLGAGKTTLVRAMLRASGIESSITSPTFTYVNLYKNAHGKTFYHFDLYRIETVDDFIAAGFDEYLYAPESCALIEWPQVIMPLLTHDACHVELDYHEQPDKRVLMITCE